MPTTTDAVTGDPLVGFNFGLEVSGIMSGYFTSVSGLGDTSEVAEHNVVGESGLEVVRKIPGRITNSDITLKRAITTNMDAWDWRKMVENGNVSEARKNGSIIMYSQEGDEVARWNFERAWPSKIEADSIDSGGSTVMQESITIVFETLIRET